MILDTICAVAWLASLLPGCPKPPEALIGYVEGEYVSIAPIAVARVASETVRRGDALKAGDAIATLETRDAEIAVRNAEAALAQAQAELANILYGRRPEEIAALEASLASAKLTADDAKRTFDRKQDLLNRGFASQSDCSAQDDTRPTAAIQKLLLRSACPRRPCHWQSLA